MATQSTSIGSEAQAPVLLDRVLTSTCQRIALLGLHPHAGTRTVLAALVRELHRRDAPFALTSAPRLPVESDPASEPLTRLALPAGAIVGTASPGTGEGEAELEHVVSTGIPTPLGEISIYRVVRGGEVRLFGPDAPESMAVLLRHLGEVSGGVVLVDGGWDRRAFAAPGVTDGIIVSLGSGLSATPERSAAAARYLVEMFSVPPCDEPARVAWEETASRGAAALLDAEGRPVGILPPGLVDPVPALRAPDQSPVATIVLPHGLNDDFMVPLVRSQVRCALVVRDSTRINVAPIYFKAWLKGRGSIQVVRAARLLAVATNPINHAGPDAEAAAFRQAVAEALPGLAVHDVVLESGEQGRKPIWKFWE